MPVNSYFYQVRTFCQKSENQLLLKDLDTQTAIL